MIRLIEEDNVVLGVVLLYPQRDGEVAFFTRNPRRGIGTRLLGIVEKLAREAQLPAVWAWVREDNPIAGRVFEKCGYRALGGEARIYQSGVINGTRYVRYLTL